MTILETSAGHFTQINTFTVDPARADELIAVLSDATEATMRHRPGFVSANLHMSRDRRHVANYAQWRSEADFDAMLKHPSTQPHMQAAAAIAISYEPIAYDLRETHAAGDAH